MKAPVEILRWPTTRSKEWVCRFLQAAQNDPNILAIVAVGSAVRKHVRSVDLDLIVICLDPPLRKESVPLEIDLRVYPASEVNGQIALGHDMLVWAAKFGRVLFQREQFWDRLVEAWMDRWPLPSAAIARQRAADAYRRFVKVSEFGDADAAQEQAVSYVTHLARAALLDRGVFPASRPELRDQLRAIGNDELADRFEQIATGGETSLKRLQANGEGVERDALLNVAADVV